MQGHLEFESREQVAEFTANDPPFNPFHRLMTVRRQIFASCALAALLLGAGCGGDSVTSAEVDDALYQQAQQLKRAGRHAEALATFIKVIEKRGEQASPESNLEVAVIYEQSIKDPVEAIHYFRKYLDLEPNSQQAPMVRQRVDLNRRELLRGLPGSPREDQMVRLGNQELDRMQRKIEELEAELGRQRNGAGTLPYRTSRGPAVAVDQVQIPVLVAEGSARPSSTPPPEVAQPIFQPLAGMPQTSGAQMSGASSSGSRTPAVTGSAGTGSRTATGATATPPRTTAGYNPVPSTSQRPGGSAPTRPGATSGAVVGRRHRVAQGEGLYGISRSYNVTVEAIVAVNRDVLPNGVKSILKPGMELKIP
jgi:LysM repeat protein